MRNIVAKHGIIYGVVSIILGMFVLYGGAILYFSSYILVLLVPFVIFWLDSKEYKRQNDGYIDFGELIKSYFVILAMGAIMSFVFSYVHYSVISDTTKEANVEQQKQKPRFFGFNATIRDDYGSERVIEYGSKENLSVERLFGFPRLFMGFFVNLIGCLVLALIGAAIFKKAPKEDIAQVE